MTGTRRIGSPWRPSRSRSRRNRATMNAAFTESMALDSTAYCKLYKSKTRPKHRASGTRHIQNYERRPISVSTSLVRSLCTHKDAAKSSWWQVPLALFRRRILDPCNLSYWVARVGFTGPASLDEQHVLRLHFAGPDTPMAADERNTTSFRLHIHHLLTITTNLNPC